MLTSLGAMSMGTGSSVPISPSRMATVVASRVRLLPRTTSSRGQSALESGAGATSPTNQLINAIVSNRGMAPGSSAGVLYGRGPTSGAEYDAEAASNPNFQPQAAPPPAPTPQIAPTDSGYYEGDTGGSVGGGGGGGGGGGYGYDPGYADPGASYGYSGGDVNQGYSDAAPDFFPPDALSPQEGSVQAEVSEAPTGGTLDKALAYAKANPWKVALAAVIAWKVLR